MRLFNFVKKHHAVRLAANFVSQFTAVLVTDITSWRSEQARRIMLLAEFAHVDFDKRFFAAKNFSRQHFS